MKCHGAKYQCMKYQCTMCTKKKIKKKNQRQLTYQSLIVYILANNDISKYKLIVQILRTEVLCTKVSLTKLERKHSHLKVWRYKVANHKPTRNEVYPNMTG